MEIFKEECFLLNYYLINELSGSMALGAISRITDNLSLKTKLIWHSREEIRHARLWFNLLNHLKISINFGHDKGVRGYWSFLRENKDLVELLAFFHIYELRVPFHFSLHAKWTQNDQIRKLCLQLVKEEGPHLSWIRDYLKKEYKKNPEKVKKALLSAVHLEKSIYDRDISKFKLLSEENGKKFIDLIKKETNDFNNNLNNYIKSFENGQNRFI